MTYLKDTIKTQHKTWCRGFTMLELLIVIGIVAILGAAGSGIYTNYNKNVEIKSISQTLIFDLKQAQSKSMTGAGGFKWGIHFVNDTTDYYEIFSTPTVYSDGAKVIDKTVYLPAGITFSEPISSNTKDIIFNKISGGTTESYVSLISQSNSKSIYVSGLGSITDSPTCGTYTVVGPDTLTYGTVLGADGECWLDRNLGATRVATSFNDVSAYGHLYQWGRGVDGHQIITSGTTTTLSASDTPGNANFIKAPSLPQDWRSPQNNSLWQGINGTNNPCPVGFRIPTGGVGGEWVTLLTTSGITNYTNAYNASLKLVVGGYRDHNDASLNEQGVVGYYWSSQTTGTAVYETSLSSTVVDTTYGDFRSFGFSVRCVRD